MLNKKKEIPIYRIAVLGMMHVGKTSLVTQFTNKFFTLQYEQTNKDIRYFNDVTFYNI